MIFSKKFKLNKVLFYIYDNTYIIYPILLLCESVVIRIIQLNIKRNSL